MAAYYIEILDNLHVVDIYAEYGKLQLVNDSNVEIGEQLSVKLPVATIPHSATRTTLSCAGSKQVNWTRIRVPIAHSSRQQRQSTVSRNITDIGNPVAAASIEGLEDICCRACGAHMLSSGLKSADYRPNVRNLPSAHWSELVDCWVCHPEEDNLRVNPDLMHSFEPEKNTPAATDAQAANTEPSSIVKDDVHVWVGNTFILVSTACLKSVHSKHVPLDAKERYYNAFTALECDVCSSVVGEVGHIGVRQVYKLMLHRIKLVCARSEISVSLSQSVCSEILNHSGAHAVYKYAIEGRQSCKPVLLVHLVGWNAELLASSLAKTEHGAAKEFEKCVKVLFLKPEDAGFELQAQQWLDSETVELVSLLDDDCTGLLRLLTTNSLRIPPQLRTMGNMTRSFLPL